jgi:cytochrome c oxidase assembly factor CtaG
VDQGPSLLTSWSFNPIQLVPTALVGLLYARRVRTLRRTGVQTPRWRQWSFYFGIGFATFALVSPIDVLGEERFLFMHMTQHIILGDLAPLFFVLGLTGPILRPVLALPGVARLRVLANPLVALPFWAINLYVWHIPFLYEAAIHNDVVHALEHFLFFTGGALMWAAVFEILPGPAWFSTGWKLGYVVLVRVLEGVLGNIFIWSGTVFYSTYDVSGKRWGLSPLGDQGLAGAIMMVEGSIVTLVVLAWLFLRLANEGEMRQQLLERGVDPRTARRAVRYGRADVLNTR